MPGPDVEAFLQQLNPTVIRPGLERIRLLLSELGHPESRLNAILIAGTNGKGSVAACLSSILAAAGQGVGTYTSPHLRRLAERVCYDGKPISRKDLVRHFRRVTNTMATVGDVTYFEFVTALAIDYFGRLEPDWAVLEVGLGGRWDAVNAVEPAMCVITPIGLDHTQFLGTTLGAVAGEKAAVIRPRCPVVCGRQTEAALRVVETTCRERQAPLSVLGRAFRLRDRKATEGGQSFTYMEAGLTLEEVSLPLLGGYQADNAACAIRAFRLLCEGDRMRWSEEAVRQGLSDVRIEGRLQVLSHRPLVVVDGAHNDLGARTLAETVRARWADRPLTLIFGVLEDKDYIRMAKALFPLAAQVVLVPVASYLERSADPRSVADRTVGFARELLVAEDLPTALDAVLPGLPEDGLCLIAGSLYLAGEAITFFEELTSSSHHR